MQEMQNIANQIFSNNALGLTVAAIIFLVTVILIVRKLIGVVITVILLFFAIISGLAISHNDIVHDWLSTKAKEDPHAEKEDWETRFTNFKNQLIQNIEDLRKEHSSKKEVVPEKVTPDHLPDHVPEHQHVPGQPLTQPAQ